MFLRIFSAGLLALALTSCGAEAGAPEGTNIDCAIGAGADYSTVCTIERVSDEEGDVLLLHHPDGGFRRLTYKVQTGELSTVDGADLLEDRSLEPGKAREFAIGEDRYLVPIELLVGETSR